MLLSQTPPTAPSNSNLVDMSINRIVDGDTLIVKDGQDYYYMRLSCIDAPESKQKGGADATHKLQTLLPKQTQITVDLISVDKYGRIVGVVFDSEGMNVNSEMLRHGNAVIYQNFMNTCQEYRTEFLDAETEARVYKRGFWQAPFCYPLDFRYRKCDPTEYNTSYYKF